MRSRSSWRLPTSALAGLALALVGLALPAGGVLAEPPRSTVATGRPQTGLKIVPLTIETKGGKRHLYKVEVAATPTQQEHGMMFRTAMAPGTGMIFPLGTPRNASFWMRNTLVSLDIVFIGADGRVRNIAAGAVPKSEAMLSSVGPVAAVLELTAGEAERIGMAPGDRVLW